MLKYMKCECGDSAEYAFSTDTKDDGTFNFNYYCNFHGSSIYNLQKKWRKLYTENHGNYWTEKDNAPDFWSFVEEYEEPVQVSFF